jgi:hypothetical protein
VDLLLFFILGFLTGWDVKENFIPKNPVVIEEEYVIPPWTQEDEDAFNKRNGIDPNVLDVTFSTGTSKSTKKGKKK